MILFANTVSFMRTNELNACFHSKEMKRKVFSEVYEKVDMQRFAVTINKMRSILKDNVSKVFKFLIALERSS